MIVGVLNGYYRTGTTAIWWILQQSNPHIPILYEPHSLGLYNNLLKAKTGDEINSLHGVPICKPYFMIADNIREKYIKFAKPKPVYTDEDFDDAIKTVNVFNCMEKACVIQSNQLHPILQRFADYYGCRYVHMVRDVAEVLYSHCHGATQLRTKLQELAITHFPNATIRYLWLNHAKYGKFEIRYMLEVAKKLGYLNSAHTWLEKFVHAYVWYNYKVFMRMDSKGMFVRFEDMVARDRVLKKVANWLHFRYDKRFNYLSEDKAFRAPMKLRNAVKRCLRGGIKRMYEEMGYP